MNAKIDNGLPEPGPARDQLPSDAILSGASARLVELFRATNLERPYFSNGSKLVADGDNKQPVMLHGSVKFREAPAWLQSVAAKNEILKASVVDAATLRKAYDALLMTAHEKCRGAVRSPNAPVQLCDALGSAVAEIKASELGEDAVADLLKLYRIDQENQVASVRASGALADADDENLIFTQIVKQLEAA